ncbi:hypothetical protein C8J56DRAFT_924031 [Mycena floridula]|nr:hypothetical protein C8J56DRAFT_924031 [Mycena floridula]
MSITPEISTELWLEIFSHLSVTALIQSCGVCKTWKHLIPLADIHPARRALVRLYHFYIRQPEFILSRPATIAQIQPFDRQAYLADLLSHNAYLPAEKQIEIPDEFYFYILEWPSRAIYARLWPGFMTGFRRRSTVNGLASFNRMSIHPAQVHIVPGAIYAGGTSPLPFDDSDPDEDPAWLPRERHDVSQPQVEVTPSGTTAAEFPVLTLKESTDMDLCLVLKRSLVGPDGRDFGNRALYIQFGTELAKYHTWTWCSFQIVYLKRLRCLSGGDPMPKELSPEALAHDDICWREHKREFVLQRKDRWRLLQPPST